MSKQTQTVTLIGAGITGCFLAILLAKRGIHVTIYERSAKKDIFRGASKRSINVTFYGYGVKALQKAGLLKIIKPHVLKLNGSITQVGQNTHPILTRLTKEKMPYYTISRSRLLQLLIHQAIRDQSITIHFEKKLVAINRKTKTLTLQDLQSKKTTTTTCDVIFGTDGVNSTVRQILQIGQITKHTQEYAQWSYKQIDLSKNVARKLNLQKNFMHAWTREKAIFTAFPNRDGSFAAMLILPKKATTNFASLETNAVKKEFFKQTFPELTPLLPAITKALQTNPESYFVSMATSPWYYKDFMVILGDAAHAFLPFYGQGISTAFADCLEITRLIDSYGTNWGKIFPLYHMRKKHTDVLERLSKESFSRYTRTKKADYSAIYDKIEAIAYRIFPRFIAPPLFISVAHDPASSAEHLQRHDLQRKTAKYLGIPLLIHAIKKGISLQERLNQFRIIPSK